jgi:hypothetical protein
MRLMVAQYIFKTDAGTFKKLFLVMRVSLNFNSLPNLKLLANYKMYTLLII